MYASTTDYQSLYTPSYFGKTTGATSFTPDQFSKEILEFCSARKLRYVVDVGSGSGALAAILRHANINVLTCDFDPVDADGIHFDLSGPIAGAINVLETIKAQTAGEPWLVTCLDVLEHLDIEDVYAAVRNLRVVCPDSGRGHLIASISTRPSSAENKFHATIIPKQTWLEILKSVGFIVDQESIFESARTVRREFPNVDGLKLVSYWAKCDIFRDIEFGEPDYVLLSTSNNPTASEESVRRHVEAVLDIAYRHEKRSKFNNALRRYSNEGVNGLKVAFNLHFIQELILYRPLLDVLQRSWVVVLVRTSVLDSDALALARGFFARCGVQAIFYEQCAEIPWRDLDLQFLITGAESSASSHHIMGRQVVEAAKLHGVHTIHMQHGIWIEQFHQRRIEFGSETVWAWNKQYEQVVHQSQVDLVGRTICGQRKAWQSFDVVGSPKFVDMQLCPPQELLRWRLGLDTSKYRAVALLGTNLLWNRHGETTKSIRERLVSMMLSTPDVFFIVKLHPSERAVDAAELACQNSIVIDDVLMGILDLQISRLILAVDIVVSSLSTLLLDAAVGGKPCVQYNTGNVLAYHGVASVEIEQLHEILLNLADIPVNAELVQEYASPTVEPFYEHFARALAAPSVSLASRVDIEEGAASYYSIAMEVEASVHTLQHMQHEMYELSADRRRIATDLDALETELGKMRLVLASAQANEITSTDAQVCALKLAEEAKAELAALQRSKSWRLTAPLRGMRRFFGV